MHLSSKIVRARYQYGTNYADDLLIQVLNALTALGAGRQDGETIEVYHIGDYLDLWRESLAPATDERVALDIKADHPDLVDALENPRLAPHFLFGNHDFGLWQWHDYEAWDRRYYIPGDNDPAVMVMHGDYFDWVELLPEFAKDMAVHVFARGRKPSDPILVKMMKQTDSLNAQLKYGTQAAQLKLDQPAPLGAMSDPGARVVSEYNVQRGDGPGIPQGQQYLAAAAAECVKANRQFELNMKAVIIGHTHRARIAVQRDAHGALTFALIDTGAWIEQCRETEDSAKMDNAQITALSANEVRIYQLEPKA
jgi:UDP-2,3-diacylglucosamine pyrophosphatase LpxH